VPGCFVLSNETSVSINYRASQESSIIISAEPSGIAIEEFRRFTQSLQANSGISLWSIFSKSFPAYLSSIHPSSSSLNSPQRDWIFFTGFRLSVSQQLFMQRYREKHKVSLSALNGSELSTNLFPSGD
jgi:hypothetical protein